jgi:hypothetical protein
MITEEREGKGKREDGRECPSLFVVVCVLFVLVTQFTRLGIYNTLLLY